jgi:putative transposase
LTACPIEGNPNPLSGAETRWGVASGRARCRRVGDGGGGPIEPHRDNGSQFTAKDFKQLVRQFDLEHIRIRTYHPESNGRVERLHRSTREALGDEELHNLGRAREIIGRWVKHYNENRLHASLDYLPPAEYYAGAPAARIEERREKLEKGRERRREKNEERLRAA